MRSGNQMNDLARVIPFDRIPKSVLAAVLVSIVSTGGEHIDKAWPAILKEWWALYQAELVTQRPPESEPDDSYSVCVGWE
jgi:hypothetical protein